MRMHSGVIAADGTPPGSAPSGLSVTGGTTQVSVSWSSVVGATSYDLRHSLRGQYSWTTVTGVTSGAAVTGLLKGQPYDVEVRAVNSAGTSDWSVLAYARVTDIDPTAVAG